MIIYNSKCLFIINIIKFLRQKFVFNVKLRIFRIFILMFIIFK